MSAAPRLALVPASVWLSAEEVMERMGWSRSTFFRRIGELVSRESQTRRANGRPDREYLEASLPSCLAAPSPAALVPAPPAPSLGPLFMQEAVELPRETLADPEQDAQAKARFDIILPILTYDSDPDRWRMLRLADGRQVTSKTRLIAYIAESNGLSIRSVHDWLSRFRDGGYAALADKPRRDKGSSRWAQQNETTALLAELAAYAHIREGLSVRMAWEIVEARAQRLNLPVPSYETIRRILAKVNPAALTLSRDGRRAYDEVFAPYISREYSMQAGEILVSDHAIHDAFVQDDIFDCDRSAIRLRFTGLEDMRSRRITAYAWSQEGSSRSITTVLRQHCVRFGRFRLLYVDNGRDYQKIGRGARGSAWGLEEVPAEALGVVARLDAEIKFCIPFHPQSKLIERANNTLHERFDRRWISYCGSKPELRPEKCDALLKRHAQLVAENRADESELPLASEFIRAARAWIELEYNERSKDVEGMPDMTPAQAWDQFRWSGSTEPVDPAVLVPLLSDRVRHTIQRGRVRIEKRWYEAADPESEIRLHDRQGEALILYDKSDPNFAAAADDDGRVFAILQPVRLVRQDDSEETRAAIAASMQGRQRLHKRTRQLLDNLDQRVLGAGYIPQHNQLLAIGQLPMPIDELVVQRPLKTGLRPEAQTTTNTLMPGQAADRLAERLRRQAK